MIILPSQKDEESPIIAELVPESESDKAFLQDYLNLIKKFPGSSDLKEVDGRYVHTFDQIKRIPGFTETYNSKDFKVNVFQNGRKITRTLTPLNWAGMERVDQLWHALMKTNDVATDGKSIQFFTRVENGVEVAYHDMSEF